MTVQLRQPSSSGSSMIVDLYKNNRFFRNESDDVKTIRQQALATLQEAGLPNKRVEAWKYTDLRSLLKTLPPLADSFYDANAVKLPDFLTDTPHRVVFINGHFAASLSSLDQLPPGVRIKPLSDAKDDEAPIVLDRDYANDQIIQLLNQVFAQDGYVLECDANMRCDEPIEIVHFVTGKLQTITTRSDIRLQEGSELNIVERFVGPDAIEYLTNATTMLTLADKAQCHYTRLQNEGDKALHLGSVEVDLGKECVLQSFTAHQGAQSSRTELHAFFNGERTQASFSGLSLIKNRQHSDITLVAHHNQPHCESRESFKTVADGEATGIFQGRINVDRIAQKTDAQMSSNALLLSDNASMNAKPELEIFADDVICAHGATCGQIDEELLFYLMARGIDRTTAETLLIQAFLGEVIDALDNETLQNALQQQVEAWLKAR
jgi:Fe-S cluster assembly protein SufD